LCSLATLAAKVPYGSSGSASTLAAKNPGLFMELACDNGERVRVAFALDCFDREVMSWLATTKCIDAGLVGDLMMQAVENRLRAQPPKTIEWLTDNGSCYAAVETKRFAKQLGL
jgi:putative transposase